MEWGRKENAFAEGISNRRVKKEDLVAESGRSVRKMGETVLKKRGKKE